MQEYHSMALSINSGEGAIRDAGRSREAKATLLCAKFEHVLFYRTSKAARTQWRDPSLQFDFVDRRKLILLVTFAGRRHEHPDRMLVLPHE
jgi:hypothetical protein